MIHSSRRVSLALCICGNLVFAFAVTHPIRSAPVAREGDQSTAAAQIRAVLRAQQDAWNRGDIDGFMNGYARAKSTIFVSEDSVRRGWEMVRDRYKKKYAARAKMGVLTFSDLEVTPFSSDAAVVLGRWHLKRAQDQPHGRFTLIFRKTTDGWRIVHDHTSAAPTKR
jgi:ketosteroid isomerase-like protein